MQLKNSKPTFHGLKFSGEVERDQNLSHYMDTQNRLGYKTSHLEIIKRSKLCHCVIFNEKLCIDSSIFVPKFMNTKVRL